ncbi:MAG TPA: HEAT repeat domain-containing protein [Gemmatimonadales bacterium]
MAARAVILIIAALLLAVGILTVLAWFLYTAYLDRVERQLAARKGIYRDLVSELATRDRALLESTINQMRTLYDLDALEAVLEEQARSATGRPGWLLEVYDRLGLVDKYVDKLRSARKWRDRAFAAELLGRVGGAKAVPVLLETVNATRTEDSDVREIALRALARIADPGAVEPLIQALATADVWLAPRIADILTRHGEAAVDPLTLVLGDSTRQPARAWAANVLGEVRAPRAFPVLVRALSDADDEVRAKAATALGRLGDRRAVGYLLEQLLTDPAPFVRLRIAASLGQFGGPEVTERLVRALGDPAWWVRMRSVEALEQIGPGAEAPLLVALDDSDPDIRARAAVALERLGVPGRLAQSIENGERVPESTATLGKFAGAGARELLVELMQHPSIEVRSAVVSAVRQAGRRDLADALAKIASSDEQPPLRALALDTLGVLHIGDGSSTALPALADPDPRVRAAATRAAAQLGGPRVAPQLRARALDPDPEVRAAAAWALGRLAADAELRQTLVPTLVDLLSDPDPDVRHQASSAIVRLGDRRVSPILAQAFPQATPDARESIATTLARLDLAALAALAESVDQSLTVSGKLALIRTLKQPAAGQALEMLQRLASDPEPEIRAAAVQTLGRAGVDVSHALQDPEDAVRAHAVDCTLVNGEAHGRTLLSLLKSDPSPLVRERAALAIGLAALPAGEEGLLAARRPGEHAAVRAAAVLAGASFDRGSLVAEVVEMPDQEAVRELLREKLRHDSRFRLLGRRLPAPRRVELRALVAGSPGAAQSILSAGMRGIPDAAERARLIGSLRSFQGEPSRDALLELVRSDPTPEVRIAALSAVSDLLDPTELLAVGTRALGDPSVMVRRAAVALFALVAPARSLGKLVGALRVADDPAVLAEAANLAEEHFQAFAEVTRALPPDSDRAILVIRIARHMYHPDLAGAIAPLALSGSPEVRGAVAELWRHRPDCADAASLDALSNDPVTSVRQTAAAAALAAGRDDVLDQMTHDPDPAVRREVAIVLGRAAPVSRTGGSILERLSGDPDMAVRAAAHVARLLQGKPLPFPPGLDGPTAAQAALDIADLPALRQTARGARNEEQRLAAALTLALVQDQVAREVAQTDPVPAIRHRVHGALELSVMAATAPA